METIMTTLTVHNFDAAMEKQLQINAKQHNCSTEEEVYRILKKALLPTKQKNFGSQLHKKIVTELTSNIELETPKRSLPRTAPVFSENNQ